MLGSLSRERVLRRLPVFVVGFGGEGGGSGGKYHCSVSPDEIDAFRRGEMYPGDIAVPVYRAGEAGSWDMNLGSRNDVEGDNNLSLTLSRREVDFGR